METVRNILSTISGIEVFPVLAFILFFILFIAIVIWVLKLDRGFIHLMSNIPLDDAPVTDNRCEVNDG